MATLAPPMYFNPRADAQTFALPSGRLISYEISPKSDSTSRPLILLSNSLSSHLAFWDLILPTLHSTGFRTLCYDHPGHGASEAPENPHSTTFSSLAEDVYALLTSPGLTLFIPTKDGKPHLHAWIGVSMGAALGVVFADKFPHVIQKLVICDTIQCAPSNEGQPEPFSARVEAARKTGDMDEDVEKTMLRWFGEEWIAANADEAGRVRALMRTTSVDGFETCVAALKSDTFDLRPLLKGLGGKVEGVRLVVGEKDADLPEKMEWMRREIEAGMNGRRVELRLVPGAGHVSFIDGRDKWMEAVVPFLKGM